MNSFQQSQIRNLKNEVITVTNRGENMRNFHKMRHREYLHEQGHVNKFNKEN